MERVMDKLLDWKLQFQDYKTLLFTGSTEEDRTEVIKQFSLEYFHNMIHINLKNNQEVREYINTMPTGRDAYYFIEKAVHDMIVPLDTILIFNNADSCEGQGIWDYAKNFFQPEDESFLAVVGDFTEEEIEKASEYCIVVRLPDKEQDK
jgi:hypothetical protein